MITTASSFALSTAREQLIGELKTHALILGRVTLSSGAEADYYIDAKRAYLRQPGFNLVGRLLYQAALDHEAQAVGGLTMGADPLACAAVACDQWRTFSAFFVRKESKAHGLQRRIEGPVLEPGTRVMIVEDVVTSGASTVKAIEACADAELNIVGVVSVLDRLAGGLERIHNACGAPYSTLATINDVYPDRPDR